MSFSTRFLSRATSKNPSALGRAFLVLSFILPAFAFADETPSTNPDPVCVSLLHAPSLSAPMKELLAENHWSEGEIYRVQRAGELHIESYLLWDVEREADGSVKRFKFRDKDRKYRFFAPHELGSMALKPPPPMLHERALLQLSRWLTSATEFLEPARLMFHLEKVLADRPNFKVTGSILHSKKDAEPLVEAVEAFDAAWSETGLLIPEETTFILGDRRLIPNPGLSGIGPYYAGAPLFRLREGKRVHVIAMNPLVSEKAARDPGVALHERAHSIFRRNFSPDAWILSNPTAEEAFADFFSVLSIRDPAIGRDFAGEGTHLRDLSRRTFVQKEEHEKRLRGIADLDPNFYHDDSMLYSNVLYRFLLAADAKGIDLRPWTVEILNDLNEYRPSYPLVVREFGDFLEHGDSLNNAALDFEYFLAVLLRDTKTDTGPRQAERRALLAQVLNETITELALPRERIQTVAERLHRLGSGYEFDPKKLPPMGAVHLTGVGGFTLQIVGATAGSVALYDVIRDTIEEMKEKAREKPKAPKDDSDGAVPQAAHLH